jgi:hypothetical protein
MVFDVVTCGFAPARVKAHAAHDSVRELPAPGAPDFLERGHELLTATSPEQPVLVVHAASPAARRRVATLRATVRTPTMGIAFARPLTGLAAVATWLASLAGHGVPVGIATSHTLDHHAALMPTYVVTSSVAGVDLPIVRLSHHMLSWLPWTMFAIGLDEHPRITTGRLTASFPQAEGTDLVVAGSPRLADRLAGVTPAHVVERFEAPTPAVDAIAWGRARFYEQTLLPRSVAPSVLDIDARSSVACAQCGEHALGSPCPFCSAREGRYV